MNSANNDNKLMDWKTYVEKVERERSRSCCLQGCLIPLVCLIVFWLGWIYLNPLGVTYPIMLKGDFMKETYQNMTAGGGVTYTVGGIPEVNEWIKKDGADQLFVGTWQIEDPIVAGIFSFPADISGGEKTRLEIRPDYTFILTNPYEQMDWLHGFRGEVTGTWRAHIGSYLTLSIYFSCETKMPSSTTTIFDATIRCQNLWTLRKNDTRDKFLRLLPGDGRHVDDYGSETTPSWKKILEK